MSILILIIVFIQAVLLLQESRSCARNVFGKKKNQNSWRAFCKYHVIHHPLLRVCEPLTWILPPDTHAHYSCKRRNCKFVQCPRYISTDSRPSFLCPLRQDQSRPLFTVHSHHFHRFLFHVFDEDYKYLHISDKSLSKGRNVFHILSEFYLRTLSRCFHIGLTFPRKYA